MPGFIFFLLFTSLSCLAMVFIPGISMIFAVLWGTLLILTGVYLESRKILIIILINIIILLFIADTGNLLFYLSFFGLSAFVMAVLAAHRGDYYNIQKWGMITAVIGVSFYILFSYLYSGGIGINELETVLKASAAESIKIYEEAGLFDMYEQIGMTRADFEMSLNQMASTLARHLPAIFYNQAIIAVFFMLYLASNISLKQNIERLKKKPFLNETMPWQLVWIVIAGMGLWVWGRDDLNSIYYSGSNILWIMVPIAIYYGLATIMFKIAQQKQSTKTLVIIGLIFMLIVFPLSAIIFVSIIGLFGSLIDFRKVRIEREE